MSEPEAAPAAAAPKAMPLWRLPRPMSSLLNFYTEFYPLRVYNSMTRTMVPFVPMSGKRVRARAAGPVLAPAPRWRCAPPCARTPPCPLRSLVWCCL